MKKKATYMMLFDLEPSAEEYLELVRDWKDPNPDPVLEEHEGIIVVRDDLLKYGSKIRSIDYLIGHDPSYSHVKEWVFGGCPRYGYAQISLPYVCNQYGKKSVLFMAGKANAGDGIPPIKLHEYQQKGIDLGADYRWLNFGMLSNTKARAKDYYDESPETRALLPLGLEHPTVMASMIKVARNLPVKPKEIWSVGSSGTLSRSLQLAFPEADVHVVSVGHKMKDREIGRAKYYRSELAFNKAVKKEDEPPFPSAPTYDAKAWKFVRQYASKGALFWNVGA